MKRTIKNPRWTNNARTVLSAEFHYEDGRVLTATISDSDKGNPDLVEILANFTTEELEANTMKAIKRQNQEMEAKRRQEEAMAEKALQEELFAIKLKAFELDVVKGTTNRALKSQIRRAKSVFEVYAYTAALILDAQQTKTEEPTAE
jgi:transcriptional regulator of heat shock response